MDQLIYKAMLANSFLPSLYKKPNGSNIEFNSVKDFPFLIANLIQIFLVISGILAMIFIIVAGLRYAYSGGDPGRVGDAKKTLTNAIVGLILAGSGYVIVEFLSRRLGV